MSPLPSHIPVHVNYSKKALQSFSKIFCYSIVKTFCKLLQPVATKYTRYIVQQVAEFLGTLILAYFQCDLLHTCE